MIDRVGEQFGNYRLIRLLGQGGFADVYLAEHIHLGTEAAVKVLSIRLTSDNVEHFREEARTVARLIHPHIVRVLDFGVEGNTPYLAMDYAPNGTLRQRHSKGSRLSLGTIVSYVNQVTEALQYAHEKKLIHRDIKPENMLLGESQQVLLSDFGIALMAQSTHYQNTQEVIGTAAYMAPEQLQGKPRRASDQYSLGIVVYEWICGDRPFHGSFTEIYSQHMFVPPPPLHEKVPGLPPAVEEVVFTALAKDPQQRFSSVQAFAKALEQACQSAQDASFVWQNEPLETTIAPIPPSQHIWPTTLASSSAQAEQQDVMPPTQPIEPQFSKHLISRRALMLGIAGLVVAGGSITWLALSRSSSGSAVRTTSTVAPVRIHTPSPTPTSPPLGTTLYTYGSFTSKIRVLAWSPDGKRIGGGSDDYTVQVWDATTGKTVTIYRGHSSFVEGVSWSPDSKRIASGSADATVQIWEPNTGNLIYTYHGHSLWVNRISWSPNGKYIASGEQSGIGGHVVQVRVWEVSTGNTITIYRGHTNGVFSVAWSPDGTRIASCGYDGTLQIWEALTGKIIAGYRSNTFLFSLSWSPDSKHIVVGGYTPSVWVLDVSTGSIVYTYTGHTDYVGDVAWSPDNTRIAAGSGDQTVHLFNAANGNRIYIYKGQAGHIDALTWSPNGKLIASGSNNGSTQVWQAV
jgi:serine/threonine protein kinase